MTKKDYIRVAHTINRFLQEENIDAMINDFCLWFLKDNPRFNKDKFINACFEHQNEHPILN
jgi:hypothetical protein